MRETAAVRHDQPEVVGRYRIGEQLASGGMGTIHVAFDTLARREVAYKRLKVANEAARPRLTALFEREYNVLRRLKHPNIVEVYDYGVDAEGPFYTMELLRGRDLASAAPLPWLEACRVLRDVASALALLHARRLVHRDVTPANVQLTPDGRAKLIDFGALAEFGRTREVVGTPAFIAPECIAGEALDGRTDLFALGGVAYWALARRYAYPARSMQELSAAWKLPVPPPSQHDPAIPRELDELVIALLERDAVARTASAAHVIERLSAIAGLAAEPEQVQVAASYLRSPPLVGRSSVLADVRRYLTVALEGQGRSVMVEGSPGQGRSALLDQIGAEAQLAGANVLRFQPSGKRDAGLVFAILQWMRALFPALWSEQRKQHPMFARDTIDPVRPVQSANNQTDQRARLVTATLSCVEQMSQRTPLVLLIDDVHRADAESLALIGSLARLASNASLLLVTSQETGAVGSDANVLSDLRASAKLFTLKALGEADLSDLLEMVFGKVPNTLRLARFLQEKSAGNPGQCLNLCRHLLQRGEIRYELGRFTLPFDPRADLPDEQGLALARLSGLSEQAVSLLRVVCVAESALSLPLAASALRVEAAALVASSQELEARDLLRVQGEELAVASGSLRSALRTALQPGELSAMHLALSRALLEQVPASIEIKFAACHHLLSAGKDDEAIELLWEPLRTTQLPSAITGACTPVLERLLEVMRRRGHPDEHCWPLLSPLVTAGFWGDLGVVGRHREAALVAMANMTGMAFARRITPRVGKKLALLLGIFAGIWRFLRTPKRFRPLSYAAGMQRLFSAVTMSTATTASAFEPDVALHVASFLDPIEAMKEGSPGRTAREFALATAEVGAGLWTSAARRYRGLLQQLEAHQIFDKETQAGFHDGCVHGRAQAEVTSGSPDALRGAEELERCDPFFRPHAQNIRMTFHGYRGEKELADYHRKQSELLALQGGLSWSAFTVLSIRTAYIAMVSQDTLGVLQASADLERLAAIAPNAMIYRDLCLAYVATVRGRPDEAVAIYERIDASPIALLRPALELDAAFHAEALVRMERLLEAREVCERAIRLRTQQGAPVYSLRMPLQALALIEAKLGECAAGRARLEALVPVVEASQAPLPIGAVQRDLARIALIERDPARFERHFDAMVEAFRGTKNPALLQQCRRLLAEAEKHGVAAAPAWEKHELAAPANTQDLASQVPDVTEIVDTVA